ncbi:Flp pilus assembly complex ATPase component [bacterium LRH843]|nr:Flp pilus assembly complex ATPase component [bacterium LRH843]
MYDIEKYSHLLINEMIDLEATDIHFVPVASDFHLSYRRNGRLEQWRKLKMDVADRLISHFKYLSGMDIGERRKPQSSSIIYRTQESTYSLRLSTLPTQDKESLAIRILPHLTSTTLLSLPVLNQARKTLIDISRTKNGLCLLSGPTGSGKSTTLYAIIEQMIKGGGKSIITIEDPIERPIPSIVQVEVNAKAGLSFDAILRASLRHDPDVLLIGEIRDEATAALAIRASLTGHFVLATIHASNCYQALLRMIDLGVSRVDLSQCLKYVLSQRLVQIKCPICGGNGCSPICGQSQLSRAALFDALKGEELAKVIQIGAIKHYNQFQGGAKRAWALGYLTEAELLGVMDE